MVPHKAKGQKFRLKVKHDMCHPELNTEVSGGQIFNYFLVFVTFPFLLLTFGLSVTHAASASNDNFQLELEPYEEPVVEQQPTPTTPPLPEPQSSSGIAFVPNPFSFSINEPFIDFGLLSATNPVTRTTTLTVASPGSGYQVFAFANNVLRSKSNSSIPDTTCDNGSCSEITASLWENNLTYGFGFRCDSSVQTLCPEGFDEEQSFKQFSDHSKKEIIQPIMQSDVRTDEHQARITYRLNISGTQQKEAYSNIVTYIAVPNF